jgi:hypothetical protein
MALRHCQLRKGARCNPLLVIRTTPTVLVDPSYQIWPAATSARSLTRTNDNSDRSYVSLPMTSLP